ncbi:acyltransferase family protein [Hymenobacter fodinae]|uniref:Acyltransferase n=1 Tax=Hymenobacter fodinae TaxID=2510796 RepID=A0A4Z0P4M8_9BACT|nr:acyltransferase [Hymenobacter fodinae]TGE06615.1 acyltransferase [Hymenobacter fodinae]
MTPQLVSEQTPPALSTKPHYAILDGLRGIAALLVVAFHLCEPLATSHFDQMLNHGYLAVDFFFLLSGFVIGYAYDDRWGRMSVREFFKRRLVRLQPLVVLGMAIGALCFYFQDSPVWPGISEVPVWKTLLVMVIGFTLLPVPISLDVRGWQEMHPLNGPGWSLFYEYVANILYALGVRKFSNTALAVLVALSGAALIHLAVTSPAGDVIGGWSLTPEQLRVGFTRMMYPFFAGLLLSRVVVLAKVKRAFWWSGLLLTLVLVCPRIGTSETVWLNGLYDSLSIVVLFPLIVWVGASGQLTSTGATRLCKFFGDISYPIYITHFPLVLTYTGWVSTHKPTWQQALPVATLTFVSALVLAYLSLKFYDEPVRRWLKQKLG